MSILVCNRRGPVRTTVAYFKLPEKTPGCDILRLRGAFTRPEGRGWRAIRAHTAVVDLTRGADDLLGAMHEGTRYEIRRARRTDKLEIESSLNPSAALIDGFFSFYREFATRKGLAVPTRDLFEKLASQEALHISRVTAPDHGELAYHVHMADESRARLIYSAGRHHPSDKGFNAMVGRANRLLHWSDMEWFKNHGRSSYDLGGVYTGSTDADLMAVAKFKLGFGGPVVAEWKCIRPTSVVGRLALQIGLLMNAELRQYRGAARNHDEAAQTLGVGQPRTS